MHIYIHVCIYVYTYVCICMYIYACFFLYLFVFVLLNKFYIFVLATLLLKHSDENKAACFVLSWPYSFCYYQQILNVDSMLVYLEITFSSRST